MRQNVSKTITGEETFAADIAQIARALGVKNVVEVNPGNLEETTAALKKAIASDEPEVIVAKKPCPLAYRHERKSYMHVDETKCKKCGMCLKIGCPAIERDANKRVHINDSLCVYCGLCKQVCKFSALDKIDVETSKGGLV